MNKKYFFPLILLLLHAFGLVAGDGNGMQFTENKGQVIDLGGKLRPDVLYKGDGRGAGIYLRKTGLSYVFAKGRVLTTQGNQIQRKQALMEKDTLKLHRVDMDFANCNNNIVTLNEEELEGYTNYYYAHCPKGVTHVKQYNKVTYKNVYNNIDVTWYGNKEKGLEYDIVLKPHTDLKQVKLNWRGAEKMFINELGNLVIKTSLNEFYESIPSVYQKINGQIVNVQAQYVLKELPDPKSSGPSYEVTFRIQNYRNDYPLIIDPAAWITYYGGAPFPGQNQDGNSVVTDGLHNVVFSGYTESSTFPVTFGANKNIIQIGGESDPALVKFAPNGTRIWATYFGGSNWDAGSGVAVDGANNIFWTGTTESTDFPVQAWGGAFMQGIDNSKNTPPLNAWIAQLSAAGALIWSTYYGGSGVEFGEDVIVDPTGNILFTGNTSSADFPVLNPFQPNNNGGGDDAFIVKFNNVGVRQWATYYGGTGKDLGLDICTDAGSNIYVTGLTSSNDFPRVAPFQNAYGGGASDAYICQLNSANGHPVWSTYYGGAGAEWGTSLATDGLNHVFLGLSTSSNNKIATVGAFQAALKGPTDGAIIKFSTAGGPPLWGTYIGGGNDDEITGLAVDQNNNISAGGNTKSTDYPVSSCAFQTTMIGTGDMTLSKFDQQGYPLCASYIGTGVFGVTPPGLTADGNTNGCGGGSIAVDGSFAYLIGSVNDAGLPTTPGAFQPNHDGAIGTNWAMLRLCAYSCGYTNKDVVTFSTLPATLCTNTPVNFTLHNACDTSNTTYAWSFAGGNPGTSTVQNPSGIVWNVAGSHSVSVKVTSPCDTTTYTNPITIVTCGSITVQATGAAICSGSCAVVTSSGVGGTAPYTYTWNDGSTGATIHPCPLINTTYTVTVTDAASLSATSTAAVVVDPSITVSTIPTDVSCNGGNNGSALATIAGGTPGFSYLWSNASIGQTASGLSIGNYTITVTDASGCTATNTANITQPGALVPAASQQTGAGCSNSPGGGIAIASATGGTGSYAYSWNSGSTIATASSLAAGSYTVTVTDGNGCTQTAVAAISSIPAPTINSLTGTPVSCNGGNNGTATVFASGGTGGLNYSWSNTSAGVTNITGLTQGIYVVSVTDGSGCTAVSTVNITQPGALVPAASQQTGAGCSNGTAIVNTNGGTVPYVFTWSSGSVLATASGLAAGNYTVTVTDINGCTASATANINSIAGPTVSIQSTANTCKGKADGSITIITTGTGDTYTWNNGLSGLTISGLDTGSYSVTVTDNTGCTAITSAGITLFSDPLVTAGTNKTIIEGATAQLTASGGITYLWSPSATLSDSAIVNPIASPSKTTNYTVTVSDAHSCTAQDSVLIKVINCDSLSIFIPNAFSPNGDGQNDLFYIRGANCVIQMRLSIYNRWGELMFETTDQAVGWDGNYKGKPMNTGVFAYYLTATLSNEQKVSRRGNITLLR